MFSLTTQSLLDEEKNFEPKVFVELLKLRRAELEGELQALASRQNNYSLPNRLPAEVLEKIFRDNADSVYWDEEEDYRLRWISVTQVCQRWREVAINYAPLWKTIILSHPEFMTLMLARSKSMPVDFAFNSDQLNHYRTPTKVSRACGFLVWMLSQTHRFRSVSLQVFNDGKTSLTNLLSMVSTRAPALTHLALSGHQFGTGFIPALFLEGGSGAPALQCLHLERVSIPWDRIPLPTSLTYLILREGGSRPFESPFYETLSRLASLQELNLARWLPDANAPGATALASSLPLTLPSLKRLTVEDYGAELVHFFSRVRTPRVTRLEFAIRDGFPEGHIVAECIQSVRNAIDSFQNVTRLIIRDFNQGGWDHSVQPSIEVWSGSRAEDSIGGAANLLGPPAITLDFRRHRQPLPIPGVLDSVLNNFDLSTTQSLEISRCEDIPPDLLLERFSALPNVEHITFSSTPIYEFFEAMGNDPRIILLGMNPDYTDPPEPYFPALSTITLSDIDFEENGTVEREDIIHSVSWAMKGSRPNSHPIGTLNLVRCSNFDASNFQSLLVDLMDTPIAVIWDKVE